jgi:A/G-specific adenine glycosylase
MDLGATICLPKNPRCLLCPLMDMCKARENGTQELRPVLKAKKAGAILRPCGGGDRGAWARVAESTPGGGVAGGHVGISERESRWRPGEGVGQSSESGEQDSS